MKHYTNSDYALNKYSEGIVYRFADGIVEVTLADFLAENPNKTEADFRALKEFSDGDYHGEVKATYRQTWKDLRDGTAEDSMFNADISAEDSFFGESEACEECVQYQKQVDAAYQVLDKLTEVQRRRYLMHRVDGLTLREIAAIESVAFQVVSKSISGAEKKIKKMLTAIQKMG